MQTLLQKHSQSKFRIIYGTSAEKDAYDTLQVLKNYASKIHLVQAKHPRAMKIENLIQTVEEVKFGLLDESANKLFEKVIEDGDICKTINHILNLPNSQDEITIILGSFYLMAEVRECLGFRDEKDPVH